MSNKKIARWRKVDACQGSGSSSKSNSSSSGRRQKFCYAFTLHMKFKQTVAHTYRHAKEKIGMHKYNYECVCVCVFACKIYNKLVWVLHKIVKLSKRASFTMLFTLLRFFISRKNTTPANGCSYVCMFIRKKMP